MLTFRTIWLLRKLILYGKLYLCDDKNAAFVYKFTGINFVKQAVTTSRYHSHMPAVSCL